MNTGEFNQLEFNQEIIITAVVNPITPDCRILNIGPENRTVNIIQEDRTHNIMSENRTVTITCQ